MWGNGAGCVPINGQAGHGFYEKGFSGTVLHDGYGNRLADPTITAKVAVERAMDALTPEQRAAISPREKWNAVDLYQEGKITESLAKLRRV